MALDHYTRWEVEGARAEEPKKLIVGRAKDYGPGYRCEASSEDTCASAYEPAGPMTTQSEVEYLVKQCRTAQAEVLQASAEVRVLRRALDRAADIEEAAAKRLSVHRNNLDIYIHANAERDMQRDIL